ncbi:TlpA disulfide reductase family protein [Pseudomonas sp. MYb185]|uniref:TlpA family protein disulfide reductase n=1 Tax=Pseudomonas sp. MYb185 TaxID=1848729 RepID=UPI000CFAD86F|nr:TlpA disulfide reductase family protein [Pseudomonas sp. MYb185]PRB82011.1 redoxin [Pseudomonas sp. MYb185]
MISVGPFSIDVVVVGVAAILACLVAWPVARRTPDASAKVAAALILDALLVGLLAGRGAFILLWWEEYSAAPRSMLAVADGGFHWPTGLLVGIAWVWWKTRTQTQMRKPVYTGILAGVVLWGAVGSLPLLLQHAAPSLPKLQLTNVDYSESVALDSYTGQPVVLNLWATWCPPCRREMPVLEQAQSDYPEVAFVLVNQGESAGEVGDFLTAQGLELEHVLLDPFSRAMHEVGSRGLPTTLFFDAEGRLVDSHMGELTMPSLRNTLRRHFQLSSTPTKEQE